jgi:ABC-2 type transport system ATP-binding protein
MAEAVIETRALNRRFGDKTAVADLSLSVRRGEVFGFLGPNGAGKTTSLKMLLGLIAPTAGSGTVLGRPLGDRHARAKVGFLPEHFRFQDWLTGRELLRFHGRLYGMAPRAVDSRAEQLLARVDLADAAHRAISTYSKGMLQRIGLAQAMMNEPDLVFLDEPTSGLDPLGRLLVRDIIRELRAGGTTVFLNSHLLGEVEATCDRVAFLKEGRVVREMTLADADAALDVELRIGGADAALIAGLARFGHDVTSADGAIRMRVDDEETLPHLARWLVERGANLYRMSAARKTLEAWFLEVMGDDQRPG